MLLRNIVLFPYGDNNNTVFIVHGTPGFRFSTPTCTELLWSQRFSFTVKRISSNRHSKKQREKTSGYPRCESHYHATIAVNQATNNDTPVRFLQSGGRVRS